MCGTVISAQQWRGSLCVVQLSQPSSGDVVHVQSSYLRPVVEMQFVQSSYLSPAMEMQFMCRPVISAQQWRCSLCVVQLSQPISGDVVYVQSSYLSPVVEKQFVPSSYLCPVVEMQFMRRLVISAQQWRCNLCVVQLSQPSNGEVVYVSSSYLSPVVEMQFM